jgi:hypothetical protein
MEMAQHPAPPKKFSIHDISELQNKFSRKACVLRQKKIRRATVPLLTIRTLPRRINCEEPNFSSDDRCNAPVIRRKGSALLFLKTFLFISRKSEFWKKKVSLLPLIVAFLGGI